MLLVFLSLVLSFAFAQIERALYGGDLISAVFSGLSDSEEIYSVRVLLGEARKDARMVTDFNISVVVLSSPPAGNPDFILIRIGSTEMALDYVVDPYMALSKGCTECVGVFPLGSGSPFWYLYRDVILAPSAIRLGSTLHSKNKVYCEYPRSEFCVSDGRIYDIPTKVFFTPESGVTYVPESVYDIYEAKYHADGYWHDLKIEFDEGTLIIPGTIIFNDPVGQKPTFFIDRNPDGSSNTIIGYSVVQAALLYKQWDEQVLYIKNHETRLTYSLFQLIWVLAAFVIYIRWTETPPIFFIDNILVANSPLPVIMDVVFEALAIVFPPLLFLFTGVYTVIFDSWYLGVSMCVMMFFLVCAGVVVQIMFWINAVQGLGIFTVAGVFSRQNAAIRHGYVRLRIAREFIVEASLLCSMLTVAFVMRTDTFASYLSGFFYILYMSSFLSYVTSGLMANRFGFNLEWVLFLGVSFFIGSVFWGALALEVCFPLFNFFIPRYGPEIFVYVVIFHALFIAFTFRRYIVKALLMVNFVVDIIPALK
jgi:hypothetical protein